MSHGYGIVSMRMRHVLLLTAFAAALAAAAPAYAQDRGGMLRTMPHGTYECALPGDAAAAAYQVVPEEQFRISTASSYRTAEGRGTYILRGDELTFTRGPKKGQKFRRVGTNQLQRLSPAGELEKLLCIRLGGSG